MLHPFRALRFSAEAGRLADLVTQPYDKISPEAKAAYEARSPHSIVRIIRGESGPDDLTWHPQAAARLQAWKDQGLLVPDDAPAFYVYRQTFTTPDGQRHERTGVTGVLDLSQRSRVLHHERTHGKARSDRLKLLEATGVHFGQIFLLRHEGPKFDPSWLATTTDETTVEEPDGTVHRFARLNDESAAEKLERVFADSGFVIADGHHRFTVAGDYADAHPDRPGASRVMVTVVDVEDEGLVVLPTHRVLRDLPAERTRGILPF